MDVVKRNLDRIGGVIDISTELHQGTTVKLRIPITLAIIPVLIVKAADQRFAIPQVHLEELIMPQSNNGKTAGIEKVYGAEVYRLRGELLHTHQAKANILFLLTFSSVLLLSPPEIQRVKSSMLCPQSRVTRHTHGGDNDERYGKDDESSRQEFFWEER